MPESPHATSPPLGLRGRLLLFVWQCLVCLLTIPYLLFYPLDSLRRRDDFRERMRRLVVRFGHGHPPRDHPFLAPKDNTPLPPLVWVHGVSVGEINAVLPLVRALQAGSRIRVLLTSGTISSARIARALESDALCHSYIPLDHPYAVARFLRVWQPALVVFCETDLWPCLGWKIRRRGIPFALVSARQSPRSEKRWLRLRSFAALNFSAPDLVFARSMADIATLRELGAHTVLRGGDLKDSAPPPPVDAAMRARLAPHFADRPRWAAISVHPEEVGSVIEAHKRLAASHPRLLTVLCPRHVEGQAFERILQACEQSGVPFARRSRDETPPANAGIYLADTFGEVGLWSSLVPTAFVGGSLALAGARARGGHNPREPAWFGCALFAGPSLFNHRDVAERLTLAGALQVVADAPALADGLAPFLKEAGTPGVAAHACMRDASDDSIQRTLQGLAPLLARAGLDAPADNAPTKSDAP